MALHHDPRAAVVGRLRKQYDGALEALSTATTYGLAAAWGVKLGSGCRFFGRPLFRRASGSVLELGDGCLVRSAVWSNPAGVDRRCMLTTFFPGSRLVLGDGCGLTSTVVVAVESVELGRNVLCGSNVTIVDTDFHDARDTRRSFPGDVAPVSIGDDVWLGAGTMVLKGVTIGQATVVAAGSVVTRSLPAGVMAAGVPAVPVRELTVG